MSEKWIKNCQNALKKISRLSSKEDKDRLDRVRSIQTSLVLMGRSLSGWTKWVNNPATMAYFSGEELEVIEKRLSSMAESFIKFDLKNTKIGREKGLKKKIVQRSRIQYVF
jgi:hypothetical protein